MSKKQSRPITKTRIHRGLTRDETEMLLSARKLRPGDSLVLFVCQEGYQDFPVDTAFNVSVPVPHEWNASALAAIIAEVLHAGHEHAGAHLNDTGNEQSPYRPYCRLTFGRYIDRQSRRAVRVDKDVPYLHFRTPKFWYSVALPVFPAQAVADLVCVDGLSTAIAFHFTISPNVVEANDLGPRPRALKTKKGGRR